MKVRALQTIKHEGVYRVPGKKTEVFDVDSKRAAQMLELGQVAEVVTGLPEDLPGRSIFEGLGFESLEQVREFGDLTAIEGVGKKTAADVREYLDG